MNGQLIAVGLGELAVSRDPADTLVAYGLGSCVAVCAYDPTVKAAGLLHVLLPDSTSAGAADVPTKFADSGIRVLLAELTRLGAARSRIVVKIAGGAAVLRIPGGSQSFNVGERNIQAVRQALATEGLQIKGADTGGTSGRTVQIEVASGRLQVRTIGQAVKEL